MKLLPWMIPDHLAPGDAKSLEGDWSSLEIHHITSTEDPNFEMAYEALHAEFGNAGELEERSVISHRMKWNPSEIHNGASLQYAMHLVTRNGAFVAVRDHTAIILEKEEGAVVHLSHNLVAPEWRRSGLAGWMRALPISTAMDSLRAQGRPTTSSILLVCEMEHLDLTRPATMARLAAYEKAGFQMADPSRLNYLQPDFRSPVEIDASGGAQPLPLCLLFRQVGFDARNSLTGWEIRHAVQCLYKMYGAGFREKDMQAVLETLKKFPPPHAHIPLVPPTSVQTHPLAGIKDDR